MTYVNVNRCCKRLSVSPDQTEYALINKMSNFFNYMEGCNDSEACNYEEVIFSDNTYNIEFNYPISSCNYAQDNVICNGNYYLESSFNINIDDDLLNENNFQFFKNNVGFSFDYIINLVHGSPGEDGKITKKLEDLGISHSTCNSSIAELTFNKKNCLDLAKKIGLKTAKNKLIKKNQYVNEKEISDKIGFPCFVKICIVPPIAPLP